MQRYLDRLIFRIVKLWIIVTVFPAWRELCKRHKAAHFLPPRVVVPQWGDKKFLWRKAIDHNPLFATVTDKIAAKEWAAAQGFAIKPPQTLWTGTDANMIPDALWEHPIYIKGAHGWRMNIPVLTPPADRDVIIAQANGFLAKEHGRRTRQWAYKPLPRRLIVEEALFPDQDLIEVKYFTFGATVEQFLVTRHGDDTTSTMWVRDPEGDYVMRDIPTIHSSTRDRLPLPLAVKAGVKMAEDIGAAFDHVRVDAMTDGETMYLGEITVYNLSGRFVQGMETDAPVNRSWDLRNSWFLTAKQPWYWRPYANALRRALDRQEVRRNKR